MPRKRFDDKTYKNASSGALFPHSIGRGEFLARNIGMSLIIAIPLALLGGIAEQSQSVLVSLLSLIIIIGFSLFMIWFSIIPRINDLGWNTRLAWLTIIPGVGQFFGFVLLVTPSK